MAASDERWRLGDQDTEQLLAEAARYKGESLWNDAWRRLKNDRGALWSMGFLVAFALISLFAPLLPIPSPVELDLQNEPQPPVAPWTEFGNEDYVRNYW